MNNITKNIAIRYDEIADEEDRQEKRLSLRTELPREFIKQFISKNDVVLDAGGGTGINAILMAKLSKEVTLLDISKNILRHAEQNISKAGLENIIKMVQGDICNLYMFKDFQFTFIVCVGDAISYVLENRFKAMSELSRVANKGAILILGCDSLYGFIRLALEKGNIEEAQKIKESHLANCGMGLPTYVYSIKEMTKFLHDNSFETLKIASTPTITDTIDRSLFYEPHRWEQLKSLELSLCTQPELLGVGNHLLFVCRKK